MGSEPMHWPRMP
uniref:Uncharacterized protein n=1 Tax=Anguilla anguilla TaxID=7936 RepID=A0A0E9TUS8_ANGAN